MFRNKYTQTPVVMAPINTGKCRKSNAKYAEIPDTNEPINIFSNMTHFLGEASTAFDDVYSIARKEEI